jgi:hypothetical protein
MISIIVYTPTLPIFFVDAHTKKSTITIFAIEKNTGPFIYFFVLVIKIKKNGQFIVYYAFGVHSTSTHTVKNVQNVA